MATSDPSASGDVSPSSVILWLRNELRLHDNPLLQRGLELVAQGATSLQLVVCHLAAIADQGGELGQAVDQPLSEQPKS